MAFGKTKQSSQRDKSKKKAEGSSSSERPPPHASQPPQRTTQPPPYTTRPPPEVEGSRLDRTRADSSGVDYRMPKGSRPESSTLRSKAIDACPATVADLEAHVRRADNTPVGKTLRSIYESEAKRRKEAAPWEEEESESKEMPKEGQDLQQRIDTYRRGRAYRDWGQPEYGNEHGSTLKTPHDREMAARQTRVDTLPRAEREKQETWAQGQLKMNAGSCVEGFGWRRVPGGYRCNGPEGGGHKVTDELLAEGRGRFLQRNTPAHMLTGKESWLGPFYSKEEAAQLLVRLAAQVMQRRVMERYRY